MPLVNVIRGEVLPDAVVTVRTPYVRLPLWLLISWWCVKQLGLGLVVAVRGWYVTGPLLLAGCLWWRFGWPGPTVLALAAGLVAGVWWWVEPASFVRCCAYPLLARARRWLYRRRWWAAMATTGLVVRFDRHEVLPVLRRVRSGLLYGIQPDHAHPKLTPGRCRARVHQRATLGLGGRRVLISRQWSGKTLADHRADNHTWVRALLGTSSQPDQDGDDSRRYAWELARPGDPDLAPLGHRLLRTISERIQQRVQLDHARRTASAHHREER